jgi:hypothetical protein
MLALNGFTTASAFSSLINLLMFLVSVFLVSV